MTNANARSAANSLRAQLVESNPPDLAQEFIAQLDAYYAHPSSSFYIGKLERRFYKQKVRHLAWKPYPEDGLVTFGASGTDMCDRQIFFKNSETKPEKSADEPFRGRQRRQGTAIIDFVQLDLIHMPARLGESAEFTIAEDWSTYEDDDGEEYRVKEWVFEDAAQQRKVFERNGVQFAITAKPDGILDYKGQKLIFEYKTKATGLVAMNGKLDFKGADSSHLRQVTAESLIFGINEGIILYESTEKPSWFSDEENKSVPKTRKTWADGSPKPDLRAFHFKITEKMQEDLLNDLAEQARLVYEETLPKMTIEMTGKCAFCAFKGHCKSQLTAEEKTMLIEAEQRYATSNLAGKYDHKNLREYLSGLDLEEASEDE
ncbi:hypothetical protein ACFWA2_14380 [Bacillus subtilis]|uniref:hypothetical protein n=1 Tax=Bacillus subtilis TaxID=1423 RepID=UPI00293910C7|nr:hypothetical protein [Bacillus subtilis]WNA14231.1 hypothetical protein phi182_63 [Bacillus phage phi18-2]WOF29645.1 hypothetical protein OEJ84_17265 [Bacillus subtilis]